MKYTQGLWWGLFLASEKSIKVKEKMELLKLMSSPTSEYNGSVGGLICDWDLRSNGCPFGSKVYQCLTTQLILPRIDSYLMVKL